MRNSIVKAATRLAAITTVSLLVNVSESAAQDTSKPADTAQINATYTVDTARVNRALRAISGEAGRLGRAYFTIPELHDEQRFPLNATTFGPAAFIFASPYLGYYQYPWQFSEQGTLGSLAALVFVDTTAGVALLGSYNDLRLRGGLNCVWLNNTGPTWRAFVTQTGIGQPCVRPATPPPALVVYRKADAMFTSNADYSRSARFGHSTNGRTLLGFQCLNAWCEVGPGGLTPASLATGTARYERINGWHDEQRLAERTAAGGLRPSVRATLYPDQLTGQLAMNQFTTWRRVARMQIHDPVLSGTKYYRWGLRQGWNRMEAMLTAQGAWLVRVTPVANGSASAQASGAAMIWTHVRRHVHHDVPVPGIVRFRFTVLDDGIWFPCGNACCLSDGGIS